MDVGVDEVDAIDEVEPWEKGYDRRGDWVWYGQEEARPNGSIDPKAPNESAKYHAINTTV